ncbi:MAG: MaoC family dehydratase [Cyclobacteriaceae bacterium]
MAFKDGHRFSQEIYLTRNGVSEFARLSGDLNPIHQDKKAATARGFRNLVASGPQTTALMMGFTATYFSNFKPMVGLEFSFRFKAPVYADENLKIEWMIVSSRKTKNAYELIELRGRMQNSKRATLIGAKGKVLIQKNEN